MSYSLIYSETSLKQIKALSKENRERIIKTLERSRIRPHSHAKKLVGNKYFSLRSGNYRIIIDIQENKLIIMIISLGHRRNVYK